MADVITRLRVESSEYESKIKRAQQGLLHMEEACRKIGGTLAVLEKEEKDFVQSLGQMETVSKTARGRLNELTTAFTELSMLYKRLTDEEKQADFGKALSSSLEQLKTRISETKNQLTDTNRELSGTPSLFDQLTSRLTVNIDAVKLLNVGLQAASAALGVAKDAFFASETTVDEWGRTMAASESLYTGFLTALNNSDVSGFLGRIDEIVGAARRAYDELDRLGTMKTIQSPAMSAQETENQRMRTMLMTGRYIAPTGMQGANGMKNGDLLSKDQMRAIEQHLQRGMGTIVELTKNELNQTGKAIDAYYDKIAKENGMTMAEFRKGVSSMSEFDRLTSLGQKYVDWERQHTANVVSAQTGGTISMRTTSERNPYEAYKQWSTFRVDKQGDGSYNDLVGLIKQRDQQMSQMYSTMGQAYRTINRVEGVTPRSLMGGRGGRNGNGGGGSGDAAMPGGIQGVEDIGGLISSLDPVVQAFRDKMMQALQRMDAAQATGDAGAFFDARREANAAQKAMTSAQVAVDFAVSEDALAGLKEEVNAAMSKLSEDIQPIEIKTAGKGSAKIGKETMQAWQSAAAAVNNVGSALQSLEDPSAKIAGIVGQAVANIALGFAQAAASPATGAAGVFGWIAAATAGLATMVATIASIKNATKGYAEGGIIPGNSYSGDNQWARVNAGEVILNRAQAANVAGALQADGMRGYHMEAMLSGEDIRIALTRNSVRRGKGEYITSRRIG